MSKAMKIARIEAGLTQQDLARRARVSESTVTRIETGRSANRKVCDRLAKILGCDALELFPGLGSKNGRGRS